MLFVYFLLLQVVFSAPVKYVTRMHTAEAVTATETYTTGTTTVYLPPVQLLISNGVTYTSTLTESPAGTPTTTTSVVNDPTTTEESSPTEKQPEPQDTQGKAVDSKETNSPDTTESKPETTEAPEPETTKSPEPETTQKETTAKETTAKETTAKETTAKETTQHETTENNAETETPEPTTTSTITSTISSSSSSSSTSTPSPSSSGSYNPPHGIVYSPYSDDGSCKSSSTVESDLQMINGKGIKHIRTYGTDCESLKSVLSVSKSLGISVNQGLWMSSEGPDSLDDPVSDLIDYIKENGDDVFDFITIANEAVITNFCSVDQLLSKIKSVKKQLQDAGYNGKVTTAEPPVSYNIHPELCDDDSPIDFVSINPHSYFNADIDASQAGSFIMTEKKMVEKSCPSMKVLITETGYPSKGDTNGKNVPSEENQSKAIKSILDETDGDITILTTYNDFWKDPGPYNIEQYFGSIKLFT